MSGTTPVFCCMKSQSYGGDYSGEDYYPDQFGGKHPPPAFGYLSWNYRPGFGNPPKPPPSNFPSYPSFPQNSGGTNQQFPGNSGNVNQGGFNQFPSNNPSFGATPNRPAQNQPSTFPPIVHSNNDNDALNKQLLDLLQNAMNSTNVPQPITSNPLNNNNNPPQNTNLDVNLNQQGGVDLAAIQTVLGSSNPNAAGSIDLSPYVRPTFQDRTFLRSNY